MGILGELPASQAYLAKEVCASNVTKPQDEGETSNRAQGHQVHRQGVQRDPSVRGHLRRGDVVPVLLRLHLLHHCLCLHPQQIHRAALLRPTRPRASWDAQGESEKCEATSWKGGDERGLEHIFTLHILLEKRTRRRFFPFIFSWEGGDEGGLENTFSPCILEKMVVVTFTLTLRETMVILILTLW